MFSNLKPEKTIKAFGQGNSQIDLVCDQTTDKRYILKRIRNIDTPLQEAMFYKEPKRIAIISSHILKYLTNNVIRQELIDSLNKTEVIICYPKVDLKYQSQKIKDEIDYIKRSVPNGSREQIKFFELEDHCDRTVIICDPGFVIGITYNYIADSEGDMYLQEYGAVYFSPTTVTHISSLIEEYVQQHLVVEASGKR